jgi:ABC-2 type transport system permease protein
MNQVLQVMTFEYTRHVFRKRFLFALLSLPLFILVMGFVIFLLIRSEFNLQPIGYVDHSGLLTGPDAIDSGDNWVTLREFEREEDAQEALNSEEIQAYYVLGPDYLVSRQTKLIALVEPSGIATSQFTQLVRANLLSRFPAQVVQRLSQGNQLVVQSLDGSREFVQGDWLGFVLPFMVGFVFLIAVFATSGYLLQAVVEEKENRTMELLVTAISPNKLMAGKIVGIIAVGWTQLIAWFGMVILLAMLGGLFFELPEWISFSASYLVLAVLLFIPAFIMLAALMVAVGATLTDAQEAQQVTSLFTIPLFLPFWFAVTLINHPNGPVAVGLSFFPFTAPITLAIRAGFASIPTCQLVLSLSALIFFALVAVWFAGRAFRLGMLRYGQRVPWREFLGINAKDDFQP